MPDAFDPYFKWLGIPKADQPPHAYRLLGIELFESDADVISNAADGRMAQIKSFQTGRFAAVSQKLLNEIAAAKVCLLNPQKKVEYDQRLQAHLQQKVAANPNLRKPEIAADHDHDHEYKVPDMVPADGAEEGVASLPFIDFSTTPTRSTTRPAKRGKQPAWIIPAGVGAAAIALVAGVAVYFSFAGDNKDKSANPQTADHGYVVPVAGDPRAGAPTPPKLSAGPSEELAIGTGAPIPKRAVADSTGAAENMHNPATQPAAPPTSTSTPKLEVGPKPKIELVDNPEPTATPEKAPGNPADSMVVVRSPAAEKEPGKEPAKKLPVPDKEQYQAMKGKIVKIFQKEFAEAKTPEAKLALAVKLDVQGDTSKDDPVERYSLWRIAADGACAAGNFAMVVKIVDKIQAQFDVDGDALKLELFNAGAARSTLTTEAAHDLCEAALSLADAAVSRDDFDAAGRFAKLAATAAHRVKDPQFNHDVLARDREIEHLKGRYAFVAKATETLIGDPDNAAANLAVGQWHCFARGDWEKGLPYLAKGSREDLAALAKQELAKPAGAKDQVALGDTWWALAEKDHTDSKRTLQARAVHWYEQAAPSLSGLEKIRVDKQIAASKQEAAGPKTAERPVHTGRGNSQPGNVALLTNGTMFIGKTISTDWRVLFDGDSTKTNKYVEAQPPFDWMIILSKVYNLKQIRFKFLDVHNRSYRYRLSASADGKTFALLADRSQGAWNGWQTITFSTRPVKFIKLEAIPANSPWFTLVQFEAYCVPPVDSAQK